MTHLNPRIGGFRNGPDQGGIGVDVKYGDQVFAGEVEIDGEIVEGPNVLIEQLTLVTGPSGNNIPGGFRGSVGTSGAEDGLVTDHYIVDENAGAVPWPVGLIVESFLSNVGSTALMFTNLTAGTLNVPGLTSVPVIRFRFL